MTALLATFLAGLAGAGPAPAVAAPPVATPRPAPLAPSVFCARPPRLQLIRFEDGSARLDCGRRLLVRVAVPW